MAQEPKCIKCGDYVHWGPVLCEECSTILKRELSTVIQERDDARAKAAWDGPWQQGAYTYQEAMDTIATARARIAVLEEADREWDKHSLVQIVMERRELRKQVATLEEALEPFRSGGQWGTWKAYLVNGAITKEKGIAAAQQLTLWQVGVDAALAVAREHARLAPIVGDEHIQLVHIVKERDELKTQVAALTEALTEISKGEGVFSLDRLRHAKNTIESMKEIAQAALTAAREQAKETV